MPLFLSDEEFSLCSNDAAAVAEKADAFIRSLLNELETVKAKADASDINAEQNCSIIEQKYLSLTAEFSKLESHVAELQVTLDQRLAELAEVQTQKEKIHLQSIEKDREIERLRTEVSELHKSKRQLIELNEQKNLLLSEKNAAITSYLDKIVNLSENAAQKESRLSKLEAELARSRAECSRLSQEKEIVERQNVWLNDDLTSKVNSSFEMRRKHTEWEADMASKLSDVERQLSECSKSLQWNKDRVRELEMKLKSTHEELISAKDYAAANEQKLYNELSTVNKLNELYKESSEEWSRKATELEGVIKAVESHLKQIEDDYKQKLEKESSAKKQFEKEASELKAKLESCEAEIERSKKNERNLLPHSGFNPEPWLVSNETSDLVEESNMLVPKIPAGVSGTALAASLLRDGWSLGRMYAKYQEAVDALRHEQLGRKESEAILQRVLYELEEKAEAIIDERAEHEKMAEAYSLMNQKLQNSHTEKAILEKTIQELKADLRRHERDYNLAQKEIIDLQKQVTVLLKECRDIQLRCGSIGFDTIDNGAYSLSRTHTETDAEKVISEHLLTFKDINGLVEQNVQLRSLARSLSNQIENKELEFKEKLDMELRKHTEEASNKVTAVLQRAEEQGRMIESLHASVAMYKRLYEEEHSLHLSHSSPSEAPTADADEGRNNLKTIIERSQEATKKSLEKAMERVRCLEDDLAKSRSENIILRSERDKSALEANFARERLDSFLKEFEHQKAETNGLLARNVEFSQLIVDYQQKLRESSESLNATEELSRKLSMELSVLKNEKEIILNAEKRASDEVRSLSERVQLLQASLATIQSAEEIREEARAAERRKQEEYIQKLEREWAEAKKELQEERESVRTLTLDRDQTVKNALRQVEEMGKELANALRASASAESRAAVAEAKLSGLQRKLSSTDDQVEMDGVSRSGTLSNDEIVVELHAAKQEIEKWKEEAQANKSHMLQYKSIAEVNEDALKQIEVVHENLKIEADNAKKALEAELSSLREKVSELENETSLKSEEVASAAAGKEEALASAMAEISNLKQEILAKSSEISAMEIQIAALKEDLDKEHQRWRTSQTNYERQVILQSETIQELTKTSQALAALQEEAAELRKLADAMKIENNELKVKWEEEKAVLEKSKNDAERKYNEINEQNKILHSRLEALHIQWAEKERNIAGISSTSSSADTIGDAGLQNVISYLRRSKEIAETEISLLKQEKLRLHSQLESALKAADYAHASLEAERAKSKSLLFGEEEFKSLQLQVRELNLLRESNMQLREENKHNFEECQKLREIARKARAETENVENLLKEKEIELEGCKHAIETLKTEKNNLDYKVSELLERCKNIDVEEYDRMKNLVRDMQDKLKEKDAQADEMGKKLLEKQNLISHLEQDLSKCRLDLEEREKRINDVLQAEVTLKLDVERHKKMLAQFKKRMDGLSREKEDLGKENQQLSKQLEEMKQGKRDVTGDQAMKEEKDTRIQILEKHLERLRDELKKEKEDNRMEKGRRFKTEKAIKDSYSNVEQEKAKFINELERHKEAVKRLSDEIEKLRHIIGNLPEGTNVAQLLSGSNTDELASPYISAVENFEKEAQSVFSELGGRVNLGDTTSIADTPGSAAGPLVSTQSPGVVSNAPGASSLPPKATEESKKKPVLPKANVEPRKTGRRLVRPRLGKPEEPQGDREMSEAEGTQIASKPGSSGDTDTQTNLSQLPQSVARKRVAPTSTSELHDESVAPGENTSDVGAPSVKKSKGSDSPLESAEGQPAATPEHTGSQPVPEESCDGGELLQGQNEEAIDAQNEGEVVEKVESKDPQHVDTMIQEESQGDKSSMLEENLDQTVEIKVSSDDMQKDQGEPDNQQSAMEVESEKEEGELLPEGADVEGCNDASNLVENQEIQEGHSEPAVTPELSQTAVDDEALEAGEINSPELSTDDKNEEGEVAEEAADGSDKSNDANDQIAAETDQVAEPAPSPPAPARAPSSPAPARAPSPPAPARAPSPPAPARAPSPPAPAPSTPAAPSPSTTEGTTTSNALEIGSSRIIPVSKQGTTSVAPETEEVKQASPVSSTSTTINLLERARERAQMRQAGVVSTIGRGRGRGTPRGRAARGGRAGGRRQPPPDA